MKSRMTSAFLMTVCLGVGCLYEGGPNEISHPTALNLPPDGSPAIRLAGTPHGIERSSLDAWRRTRDALLKDHVVLASLGQQGDFDDPSAPDLFASELDVALDSTGHILVLDRGTHAVKVFAPRGEHIRTFGRSGEGPMEFRDASALDQLPDGRLVVTERGNRIKVFSPTTAHHEYTYDATLRTGIVADYACSMSGRFFVSGWDMESNAIIHEIPLSPNGIKHSFGKGYIDDYWLIQDQLSNGPIACVEPLGLIVFAFQNLPVLKAYSVDTGEIVWTALLEGYMQPPIVEQPRPDGTGRIVFRGRGIRDRVTLLTPVSPGHILLQTVRYEPVINPGANAIIDTLDVRSHLIDAKTGQGALISESLPLIPTVDPTYHYFAAVWLLPIPRMELRRFRPQNDEYANKRPGSRLEAPWNRATASDEGSTRR